MELEGLNLEIKDLGEAASHFRRNLSRQLTESVQRHLDAELGTEMGVQVRVEVEAVALRNPAK